MKDKMEVFFEQILVGVIYHDHLNKRYQFAYQDSFIDTGIQLSPILMPLSKKVFEFPHLNRQIYRGLPPLFCDSFPDEFGSKLYFKFLKDSGLEQRFQPFHNLSYLGNRGVGAQEYEPKMIHNEYGLMLDLPKLIRSTTNIINHKSLIEINIRQEDKESTKILTQLGGSLGGSRPKIMVALNQDKQTLYAGDIIHDQAMNYQILKLNLDKTTSDFSDYGKMEYAYYLMAKDLGINISPSQLIHQKHFCTQRFDRNTNGNKIHYQSFNSFFGLDYKDRNAGIGYEDLFKALTKLKLPPPDLQQFFKIMCFNVIALNRDDHLKNFSLIFNEDHQWRLAPAYDLVYCNESGQMLHVNGYYSDIKRNDLLILGEKYLIKHHDVIIDNTLEVVSRFRNYCQPLNFAKKNSVVELIYQDLSAHFNNF